jgi:hypothetical protein
MRRQDKYPNNDFFTFYNANPKNKVGGDCVIRAICVALGESWETVVREMTELGIKLGYVLNDKHVYEKYLESKGYIKYSEPRDENNCKITVKSAIKNWKITNAVANVGSHHVVAIVNGKVNDIWDSSKQTMHTYWRKI